MSNFCKQCGADVKGMNFCTNCGAQVAPAEASQPAEVGAPKEVTVADVQELTIASAKDIAPAPNAMPVEQNNTPAPVNNGHETNTEAENNNTYVVDGIDKSPLKFISFKGRMARWEYFIGQLKAFGMSFVSFLLIELGFLAIIGIPLVILTAVYNVSLTIRRLHDLNLTGWLSLVGCVPYVNIIFGIVLLFKKGTEGANDYGLPRV